MEKATEYQAPPGSNETPAHPSPKGANKVERIAQQSRALFDDVKAWVDLKIAHTLLDVQAEIDARKQVVMVGALLGVFVLLGGVFALLTLALGLGAWLGHPAWGFLIVTVLLFMMTGLLYWRHFGRKQDREKALEAEADQKKLTSLPEQKKLPPTSSDT